MNLIVKMKKPTFLSTLLILLFLCDYCAYAMKMNVEPPRVEISVDAGGAQDGYITIVNGDIDRPIRVNVYINDLIYLPDGSNDFLAAGTTPWSVANWLKISPTQFNLQPGEQRRVRYIAEVPSGAEGGRYGVVFFEVSPPIEQLKGKTGAAINVRIGSIFLITVKGTEKYDAEFQDLAVGSREEDDTFRIYCTIKNRGNVLIRPNGSVKIIDSAETEIAELWLNEDKTGVLPGTSREFSVQYDAGKVAPGENSVQVILDYGGAALLGGQASFNLELPK